jgi:peptide/nickel transport system ATP-binding protein
VSPAEQPLLRVSDLEVEFRARRRVVRAVAGASFEIAPGETLGLVGESGSGKTTIGRAILGLAPITGGTITFQGVDITHATRRERRRLATQLQAVFQDPYSSLNPAVKVGASLLEAIPPDHPRSQASERLADLLTRVGMTPSAADQYPNRFSGGQRQRLAVARALMASPSLVVCDEPVSALDVSIQAQVLNLLRDLQREFSLGYLFIGHDLDVVRFMSDRIVVLYRGRVLEEGPADVVARTPRSPYTQALVAATPHIDRTAPAAPRPLDAARASAGPDPAAHGCPFAHRCPLAVSICRTEMPALEPAAGGGRVACHRYPDSVASPPGRSHRVLAVSAAASNGVAPFQIPRP